MLDLALPNALLAARLQFAANMTFHILFPAISIALAWLLAYEVLTAFFLEAAFLGIKRLVVVLPMIGAYTAFAYRVYWGKVSELEY
jgi:cytochrome bd-type quinol oxidase subunit 1